MKLSSELTEIIASVIHEAWISWSKEVAKKEPISPSQVNRWKTNWKPYHQLPDDTKDRYRKWARLTLMKMRQLSEELES